MKDYTNSTPFELLRNGVSHDEICRIQERLENKGKTLWDWASYAYLYGKPTYYVKKPHSIQAIVIHTDMTKAPVVRSAVPDWDVKLAKEINLKDPHYIKELIDYLPRRVANIILYYYRDGVPVSYISTMLGISELKVRGHLNGGKSTMKRRALEITKASGDWWGAFCCKAGIFYNLEQDVASHYFIPSHWQFIELYYHNQTPCYQIQSKMGITSITNINYKVQGAARVIGYHVSHFNDEPGKWMPEILASLSLPNVPELYGLWTLLSVEEYCELRNHEISSHIERMFRHAYGRYCRKGAI